MCVWVCEFIQHFDAKQNVYYKHIIYLNLSNLKEIHTSNIGNIICRL